MTCSHCGQPVDGACCTSCGAYQLRRRLQEIKLPAPIYRMLLVECESQARYPCRSENHDAIDYHYNGRQYRFSLDL